MLIPDYKCAQCAAVYSAKSWGDCGACPGCGGTTYTHETAPVNLAAHESGGSVPARPLVEVTDADQELARVRAIYLDQSEILSTVTRELARYQIRCRELERRLDAIRRAAR